MIPQSILISYSILLIFQILHILEEIGMDIYKIEKIASKKKYLRVASVIMTVYLLSFLFILLEFKFGIILGLFC